MISTFATEKATGISSLGLNLKAFIFQLITFVVIMWLLNKFALKKIFATIEKRRAEIDESLKAAELSKKALVEADDKATEILQEARAKADVIASDAQKDAAETIKEAEIKASQKAERLLAESREQITQDMTKARTQLKTETAELVARAAGTILNEKLDSTKDTALITRSLNEAAN